MDNGGPIQFASPEERRFWESSYLVAARGLPFADAAAYADGALRYWRARGGEDTPDAEHAARIAAWHKFERGLGEVLAAAEQAVRGAGASGVLDRVVGLTRARAAGLCTCKAQGDGEHATDCPAYEQCEAHAPTGARCMRPEGHGGDHTMMASVADTQRCMLESWRGRCQLRAPHHPPCLWPGVLFGHDAGDAGDDPEIELEDLEQGGAELPGIRCSCGVEETERALELGAQLAHAPECPKAQLRVIPGSGGSSSGSSGEPEA